MLQNELACISGFCSHRLRVKVAKVPQTETLLFSKNKVLAQMHFVLDDKSSLLKTHRLTFSETASCKVIGSNFHQFRFLFATGFFGVSTSRVETAA
jgi:hypothetical protein